MADIRVDYLGMRDPQAPGQYLPNQEPRTDFIPTNATVKVEFQGASAIVPGSKEVDLPNATLWSSDPADANGRQFIRYRITFDIAANSTTLSTDSARPVVQNISIHAEF